MEIRPLNDRFAVSPQIAPEDMAELAEAGYRTVICNRPDAEVPPPLQTPEMRRAAEAAGLAFVENPVTHAGLDEETVAAQANAIAASPGPALAYCASGTRSTVVWLLGAAAAEDPDRLLAAAEAAGYRLDHLRPHLEAIHRG